MESFGKRWRKGLGLFAISFLAIACDQMPKIPTPSKPQKARQEEKAAQPVSEGPMAFGSAKEKEDFYIGLVKEMYSQIYLRDGRSFQDLGTWANVLMQGGSVEGVYHGLILSNEYGELERGTASLQAVRFFAEESAKSDIPNGESYAKGGSAQELAKENLNAPLFTLKRLLGESVLLQVNAKKGDREKLAAWYAKLVVRWNALGVPFGSTERGNMDEKFHHDWALKHPLGLIQWELLNRAHRIMNQLGGVVGAR